MSKINNITELRSEIIRLQKQEKEQREKLKNGLKEIREELKPANLFMNFVSSLFGIHIEKNEFVKNGIAFGISLILQRFVLKTEMKFESKIYDWIDTVFERIKDFMNRFTDPSERRNTRKESEEPIVPGE